MPSQAGEGCAVTGRFITRRVDEICRIQVLGADGQIDIIEGTTLHPIWSVDRDAWVPLGELQEGEQLLSAAGPATILTHQVLHRATPVYNIEVHGEHVYQVGALGLLVHNSAEDCIQWVTKNSSIGGEAILLLPKMGQKFIGSIPGYGRSLQHAFRLKNGKLYDSVFENGIDFGEWVSRYADETGMTVKDIMDYVKAIPLPPGYRG